MSDHGSIYRYRQLTPFTTRGSGTAQWCVGEADGRRYFIKEFLSPTLPPAGSDMTLPANIARRDACVAFFQEKKRLYSALQSVSNGCLVCPSGDEELFIHEGHYFAASPLITPDVKPEEICHLSTRERLVLMRTLVLTLSEVHAAGIVHSDIKLNNLMVTRNATGACNLKLIDFDSAFFRDAPPARPEDVHGDLAYLAPETLAFMSGEPAALTEKLDVFALGLLLHQMACGLMPHFDAAAYQSAGEAVLDEAALLYAPSLPDALRRIIAAMLQREPSARPGLAEVYDRLGALLFAPPRPEPIPAAPPAAISGVRPLPGPISDGPEPGSPEPSPGADPVPARAASPRAPRKDRAGLALGIAAAVLLLGAVIIVWYILGK